MITLQIRFGLAECSRRSLITLEANGSFREQAMCNGVRPTIKSDISSETGSFLQPSSDIDKYSFPISAEAFGSAKLSRSNLTNSGPASPKTPHAKQRGVNEAYFFLH